MANAKYTFGAEAILDGTVDMLTATIKAKLVHAASYTPNLTADKFVTDIPGGAVVATTAALTSKSATGGAFSAANPILTVSGSQVDYIVVYADTGSPSTSRLLAFIDTATNLPFTPAGGTVEIAWDTGPNKIFRI